MNRVSTGKTNQMDQFKNKYRIPSARAQWWDYGNDAAYFITICTKNRFHFFGKITDKKLFASPAGDIAANIWYEIPANFPYAQLGAFVVMPNHVHGIIIIEKTVSDVAVPLHPASQSKSLFRILSPSQKRLIFRHFSPFFSCVAPAMRLQKRKN